MKERMSESLGLMYLSTDDKFMTSTGVVMVKADLKGKSHEAVKDLYNKALKSGDLYDYEYAKTTGFFRKRRTEKAKEDVAPVIAEVKKEKKMIAVPRAIRVLIVALYIIGALTVTMSVMYTTKFLLPTNGLAAAIGLSFAMIVFSVVAFELVVIFWSKGTRWVSVIFSILWSVVVTFSMFSTMAVNYDEYNKMAKITKVEYSSTNSNRLLLSSIKERKELKQKDIARKSAAYDDYIKGEKVADWRKAQLMTAITKAEAELVPIINEEEKIAKETPDAIISSETSEIGFYEQVERLFGVSAELIRFIVFMLPAIFIDIIAPFSIAVAIYLGGKDYGKS
jgi:ABC-type multidrug transport system fused ATPase/permease subunit